MKSADVDALQPVSKTQSRHRQPEMESGRLRQTPFLALSAALAAFIGLLIPFLGFQSGLSVLAAFLVLGLLIGFAVVVYHAARGRKWALLFFLVISVFLIDATFRKRELTDQSLDAQTILKLTIWCSTLLIAFFSTRQPISGLFHGDIKWLTLFSLLALISTAYSLTPAFTFGGGVAALSYCAMAVCVGVHLTKRQILYSLLVGMSIMLVISLGMYAIGWGMTAEAGPGLRLAGIAGSPNGLGRTASLVLLIVGALVIGYGLPLYSWRCLLPIGLAVSCLLLSDSRTATLALLAAFGFYALRSRPVAGLTVIVAFGFTILVLANLDISWQELVRLGTRSGRVSEMTTLTGRTEIWYATWNAFLERPLLGYGFGSTKVLLPEVYRNFWGFTVSQAHNLYLQTLVTTGLVGLVLVLMAMTRQIISYVTHPQLFSTFVIGYLITYGMTEPGPVATSPNILTFFWALGLYWDRIQDDAAKIPLTANYRRIFES